MGFLKAIQREDAGRRAAGVRVRVHVRGRCTLTLLVGVGVGVGVRVVVGGAAFHEDGVAPAAGVGSVRHAGDAFSLTDDAESGAFVEAQARGVLGED